MTQPDKDSVMAALRAAMQDLERNVNSAAATAPADDPEMEAQLRELRAKVLELREAIAEATEDPEQEGER